MQLTELQRNWNVFGETDPLWSVLTDVRYKNNKWDPVAFFQTGEQEIDAVFAGFDSMGLSFPRRRALDFGCAVGRLTQALCRHFDRCDGVDIAPSMIELARKYDRYPGRCYYHLNGTDDLALFEDNTFDFVYSRLVLQHMQPRYSKKYIAEFLRVLAPGGVALFQIPGGPPKAGGRQSNPFDLPDAGFRVSLALETAPPALEAGSPFGLNVQVTNASPIAWPESADGNGRDLVVLGNHWLADDGRMLIMDDGRTPLMQGLKPSESATVQLWITAPTAPGTYILELDMVKEGVAWFRQKGSKTCRAKVQVRGGVTQQLAGKRPVMEMHCVPKLDVLGVVQAAGGTPVLVTEDHSADPLLSYQYVVTKTNERRKTARTEPIRVAASTAPAAIPSQNDEILALLAGLAQHATLHARVNEGLVKRILEIERIVRETQKMVSDLCKGTQSGTGKP
jgi:SAM-dependent methyltransferase